jgi:hypothetical protein
MHRTQCVLHQDPDPHDDTFFQRVSDVIEGASFDRFIFDFETEEELADGTHQLVWVDRHEQAVVTLTKERHTGICYLTVEAVRAGDVRKLQRMIEAALDVATLETLQAEAATDLMRDPARLMRLAIALGPRPPDATSARLLRDGLNHLAPRVRTAAAQAIATTRWPGFIPDLEARLKGEPDPPTAESARKALAACRATAEVTQRRA